MTPPCTRRTFLHDAAIVAISAIAPPLARKREWFAPAPLRIGVVEFVHHPSAAARTRGLQLGLDEARHAAALFGGTIELTRVTAATLPTHRLSAVVGGDTTDDCASLSEAASAARVLHLNVGCSADDLRGAGCRPETFHVMPSDAMLRDAVALSGHPADAWAAAWDPSLVRFGADTLNQRFRARFRQSMTADAWTAWVAIKMLWEASLRTRATDSGAIDAYLRAESTQFDGHKGRPLSFRSWDQQLRQPVYVVARGTAGATRVIAELPAATTDTETSRDVLDRLGTRRADSRCRLAS
ncbi:MAG TPA: hypothetical protein VII52_10755 [Gemmatimonadaceae bacterium]